MQQERGSQQPIETIFASRSTPVAFGWEILKELRGAYGIYFLSAAIFAGISLLPAQLLHFFTVRLTHLNDATIDAFLMKMGVFGMTVAVCLAVAAFGKIFVKEWLLLKLEVHLRQRILDRLHNLPLENLERAQRGDWLTRISGDVRGTEDFLGGTLPDLAYSGILLLGTAALLVGYAGWFGAIPVVAALMIAFLNFRIQKVLRPLLESMRTLYAGLFQILLENLEGWKTVRSFGAAGYERKRVDDRLSSFTKKGMVAARLIGTALSSNDLITHSLLASCLMALGWGVATHRLTAPQALFFPFYLSQFLFSVKSLVMGTNSWSRYLTNAGRLSEFFNPNGDESPGVSFAARLPHSQGYRIHLENVAIGDTDSRRIDGVFSLEIEQGKMYGLTGPSGCGKSTFLDVIAGLRSARSGAVRVEWDNNGKRQELLSVNSVSRFVLPTALCAYVDQKPYVFEGTLKTNLTLGSNDFTDERLEYCLRLAGLGEVFAARGGLAMTISDRGLNISVGQLYRIAIARALLLRRPFLLLDEPFAALDSRSADSLVETLENLKKEVGIFLVTHYVPPSLSLDHSFTFYEDRGPLRVRKSILEFGSQLEPETQIAANRPAIRKIHSLSMDASV